MLYRLVMEGIFCTLFGTATLRIRVTVTLPHSRLDSGRSFSPPCSASFAEGRIEVPDRRPSIVGNLPKRNWG